MHERQLYSEQVKLEQIEQENQRQINQQKLDASAAFLKSIEESDDLHDNLQSLVDFISENTGATGVYIG